MRRRSSILYIPPTTFALPLPLLTSPLPSSPWQADSRQWPLTLCLLSREKVTVYVCVSVCIHIFFIYVCACVQGRLCTGNMCLNCQQREYTAKNKNSSVSIQWVCVCVCAPIFRACIYVSLCYSVWSWAWDGEVYLVCAMNDDKQQGGWGKEVLPHVEKSQVFNGDMTNSGIIYM